MDKQPALLQHTCTSTCGDLSHALMVITMSGGAHLLRQLRCQRICICCSAREPVRRRRPRGDKPDGGINPATCGQSCTRKETRQQ